MRALGRLTPGGVAIPHRLGGRGRPGAWADWRRQGLGRRGEPGLLQTHFLPQLDSRRQVLSTKATAGQENTHNP